jgi:hypothetical protein
MAHSEDEGDPAGPSNPLAPIAPMETIEFIRFRDFTSIIHPPETDRLTNDNWFNWKEAITQIFMTCDVVGYIKRPSKTVDAIGNRNWVQNDSWVQSIITNNITLSGVILVQRRLPKSAILHFIVFTKIEGINR